MKLDLQGKKYYIPPHWGHGRCQMTCEEAIGILRAHEPELRRRGVAHAAIFGSVARQEAGTGSDIDIMIEIAPAAQIDLFEYVGITQFISDLFPVRVDVANRCRLKQLVRPAAERDAVFAF